ncbi:MAG: hypothetical protein AAF600_14970 [Bacteroidota bacterium]
MAPLDMIGDCCDGTQTVADDQVLATLYLQFVATRKNLASTIAGFLRSKTYNPYIVRTEFSVLSDENGNVSLHQSQPYLANKPGAALFGVLDAASLYPGGGPTGIMARSGIGPTVLSSLKYSVKRHIASIEADSIYTPF